MKRILIAFLVLVAAPLGAFETKLTQPINDTANVLSEAAETTLLQKVLDLNAKSTAALVVDVIPSLEGVPLEEAAEQIFRESGIGQKGRDNGVLMLVAINDRKFRIEVGYGLEGTLTDAQASRITTNLMRPHFKAGNYEAGIIAGVDEIARIVGTQAVAEEMAATKPTGPKALAAERTTLPWFPIFLILVGALIIFYLMKRSLARADAEYVAELMARAEEAARKRSVERNLLRSRTAHSPILPATTPLPARTPDRDDVAERLRREEEALRRKRREEEEESERRRSSSYDYGISISSSSSNDSSSSFFDGGSSGGGGDSNSW